MIPSTRSPRQLNDLPKQCHRHLSHLLRLKSGLAQLFVGCISAIAVLVAANAHAVDPTQDGTQAATAEMAAFRIPAGMTVELFAAEPQLQNPVAFCLDDQGRVYVAEDHRFLEGTPENRSHSFLLDDDLQIRTLADRLAVQEKWAHKFAGGAAWFTQASDIVRKLEDRDGDGKADVSNVFADGFNGPLDGLGSGLIARDGNVWYTCIPNLWLLENSDCEESTARKTPLLTGFGVNAAFYGHDLHGLVWGVDGRLYFSVGDRGAHVETKEGATISNPRNGAVFRGNPDGTELELVHRGLRNPQELAVDQYGNLFADDNNCDKGDHSRLVYIVPGGDSGWNMAYQHIPEPYLTGPWHAEGIWHLEHELQPAHIVPAVGKIGAGPSGFVFSSGTSLPPRYRNHFFYCNFTGNGGVESFAVQPEGAGFTIVDHHDFCKPVKASDVDFGYDGKMYLTDYPTNPFDRKTSGGRIYTLFDKSLTEQPVVTETQALFRQGFKQRPSEELINLLHHDDMRVRLRAQFALAERGPESASAFTKVANADENQLARLHAIWGLGQLGRSDQDVLSPVHALLQDSDSEVRAQSARVLGEARDKAAAAALMPLLTDQSLRVRFFAAIALGTMEDNNAVDPLITMLRENDGRDRQLMHAGIVALERIGNRDAVQRYASDPSAAVRMAVLLVQRRWADPLIVQFLDDADLKIVTEAARAINDLPLEEGRKNLAHLATRYANATGANVVPLLRRIVNANLQLGERANAEAVVEIAISDSLPLVVRREAVATLAAWDGGSTRDRVTGFWRPIEKRDGTAVRQVLQQAAARLLAVSSAVLQVDVTELLTSLQIETDDQAFADWVVDPSRSSEIRIAALRLLGNRKYGELPQVIETLLTSDDAELRAESRDLLAGLDEKRVVSMFTLLLDNEASATSEKQRALAKLSQLSSSDATQLLDAWADRLRTGSVPASLQLDVIEALTASPTETRRQALAEFEARHETSDPLASYRVALEGGNAKRGRDLFVSHAVAQCIRCHKIGGSGGTAGPDLSALFSPERNTDREYLLESLVSPNAKIAKGFGTVAFELANGKVIAGVIKEEDETAITLVTPTNETIRIPHGEIDARSATQSAMPEMTKTLSRREIRDLVEYLSTLKGAGAQ